MAILTLALLALAAALILRGVDVRLALVAVALALASAAGDPMLVPRVFLATLADGKSVVPICSAMGFAFVLKHTGCDEHLVRLLMRPVSRVRWALVPGVLAVAFVVNIPVISQTSTAVCVGPVAVPLMRAAGLSPLTIGATLVLGASVGGELLNPGAPEHGTVSRETGVPASELVNRVFPLALAQLLLAGGVHWWLSRRRERAAGPSPGAGAAPKDGFRVVWYRALVPLVPLAILFAVGPPLRLLPPAEVEWLRGALVGKGGDPVLFDSRMIGLAMLVGTLAAGLAVPGKAGGAMRAFFDGAGYGFTHVISLIVTAATLAAAITATGAARDFERLVLAFPGLLTPVAALVTLAFACLTGSGIAATQGLFATFAGPARDLGADAADLGTLVSLAAAAGRTMSPVAAVVLLCGTLTGESPLRIAARAAPPLLVGTAVVVALRVAGWL